MTTRTRAGAQRSVLGDRRFATYWAGQTASSAGNALSTLALVFAVLSVSSSAASLGLVLLASRLPVIAFSLFGGVLGDRRSRRVLMLGADLARCGLQAVTAGLLISGHASVWNLAALQAGAGAASAIFTPAAAGLVVELAPAGKVREANSMLAMSRSVSAIVALGLAGAIVAAGGPGVAFAADAASFAISTASLAAIRSPALALPAPPSRRLLSDLRHGWAAVRERPWLCTYAAHAALLNALAVGPFFVLGPLVADHHLGGAPAWAAIAIGYALGSLCAAAITLRWNPHRPIAAAIASSLALAPLLALLAVAAPLWLLVPAALGAGAQATVYNTFASTARQANVPAELLSRTSALVTLAALIAAPAGMSLAGVAADTLGTAPVLYAAAASVLVGAAGALALPTTRAPLTLSLARDDEHLTRRRTGLAPAGH